jgi:hypothetical protein
VRPEKRVADGVYVNALKRNGGIKTGNRPTGRRIQHQSPKAQGFKMGIAQAEAHESGGASGAVFRTNPVGRNICRRPERPAGPARVARDTPEFCEWRPEDKSQPAPSIRTTFCNSVPSSFKRCVLGRNFQLQMLCVKVAAKNQPTWTSPA